MCLNFTKRLKHFKQWLNMAACFGLQPHRQKKRCSRAAADRLQGWSDVEFRRQYRFRFLNRFVRKLTNKDKSSKYKTPYSYFLLKYDGKLHTLRKWRHSHTITQCTMNLISSSPWQAISSSPWRAMTSNNAFRTVMKKVSNLNIPLCLCQKSLVLFLDASLILGNHHFCSYLF